MKTKTQVLSEMLMDKLDQTSSMRVAFDAVMGEGHRPAHERLDLLAFAWSRARQHGRRFL